MGAIDEVSSKLGELNAKVTYLVDNHKELKIGYDHQLKEFSGKQDEILGLLQAADLPKLKGKVEKLEQRHWISIGAAGAAGATAGGFIPWLKAAIGHIFL